MTEVLIVGPFGGHSFILHNDRRSVDHSSMRCATRMLL